MQLGKCNYDEITKKIDEIKKEDINETNENNEELNIADLAICRSGAMTVTEILAVGIPAIFVPLPSENSNKQSLNAEIFVENNMGIIIDNDKVTGELLYNNLKEIILKDKLKIMKENMLKYISENENKILNTLDNIYMIIKKLIKRK